MTIIRIPTPLRAYTSGMKEVEVSGDSVGAALSALAVQYPGIKPHLFDEKGGVRSYVNVFVNDQDIRNLQGHETPLSGTDRVMIIPSIAGGRDAIDRCLTHACLQVTPRGESRGTAQPSWI